MFHYLYVIQSTINKNSLYTGFTRNLRNRLVEHNAGKNVSTRRLRPWALIFYEAYLNEDDARRREKYLKTSQGSRLIKRMLKDYLYTQRDSKRLSRISTSRWTG